MGNKSSQQNNYSEEAPRNLVQEQGSKASAANMVKDCLTKSWMYHPILKR